VRIAWEDSDPDDNARIRFYVDADDQGWDGVEIPGAQDISEDDPADELTVSVASLPEGEYWIYGLIDDGASIVGAYASTALRVGTDTDGDGMLDSFEEARGMDAGRFDSGADFDRDRLSNALEVSLGLDPALPDTDGGGEADGRERKYGRLPLAPGDDIVLPFSAVLGDVAPTTAPDGLVTVADVVKLLRFAAGADAPDAVQMVRGDLAPALVVDASASPTRQVRVGDARLNVADVVLALRTAVGATTIIEWR
jgi:hypothetical protein